MWCYLAGSSKNLSNMELRVIQCQVGRFNLLGTEKSLSFSIGLFENNQLIKEGDIKARLYYSGEPDEIEDFEDAFDHLPQIFDKCYKYAQRIISSTDYEAEALLFAKLYSLHLTELDSYHLSKHKERVSKKITELQKELGWDTILWDISNEVNATIDNEICKYRKWLGSSEKEMVQYKEDTEGFLKCKKRISEYSNKIAKLESDKIQLVENS